jgi:AcrR family transcriptional regulator
MTVTSSESGSQLGRPVGASGEQTRRRIITAAMRCVAEVGYSKATIREIARAADMTSGSLYHYFPNKSELLKATGEEIEEIVLPRLRAAAAKSDNVVDRLDAVLDESKRLIRDYPYLAAFLRAIRAQSTARLRHGSPNYPGSKALRVVVNEIILDARAQGALSPDSDDGAAWSVGTGCQFAGGGLRHHAGLGQATHQGNAVRATQAHSHEATMRLLKRLNNVEILTRAVSRSDPL